MGTVAKAELKKLCGLIFAIRSRRKLHYASVQCLSEMPICSVNSCAVFQLWTQTKLPDDTLLYIASRCRYIYKYSGTRALSQSQPPAFLCTALTSLLTWGCPVLRSTCVLPARTVCCWADRQSVWTVQVQGSLRMVSTWCSLLDQAPGGTAEQTTWSGWEPSSWIPHRQCPHLPKPEPKAWKVLFEFWHRMELQMSMECYMKMYQPGVGCEGDI